MGGGIMTELEALLTLNMLPKIGPVRVRRLIAQLGSAAAALEAPADSLRRVEGIGTETAGILRKWQDHADLGGELNRIREMGLTVVPLGSELYPEPLTEIHDPPLVLYVRGKLEPRDRVAIGVVGSRRATSYGLTAARKLSFQLAHAGVTVLSGLARGIDTAAHEGAVASGGRTIAVIGSGMAHLYPPENAALADRIADGRGAVVSEFPILTEPDKQTFPQRNRIVSGWSHGILVVEAPAWSGALITANNAADQGRSVYAVPGPIDRASSLGCNKLIQNGARLVLSAEDILEDLNQLFPPSAAAAGGSGGGASGSTPPAAALVDLTDEESALWQALGQEERQMDELIDATGLAASSVSVALMRLELRRLVRQLPGRRYTRLV
ncbi:MAG: protecting protein DprA [Verrucomicrobiales bacterium]|nr:protecting protein DprA [Verrucomicrobiales bacterium]